MPILFHGTTEENAKLILRKGFKKGTFFGKHMEDAIHMGGLFVFQVWFDKRPTEYWEWISDREISPSDIRSLDEFTVKEHKHSEKVEKRIREHHIREEHGDAKVVCNRCSGRGQINKPKRFGGFKAQTKLIVCKKCQGHGYVDNPERYPNGKEADC